MAARGPDLGSMKSGINAIDYITHKDFLRKSGWYNKPNLASPDPFEL